MNIVVEEESPASAVSDQSEGDSIPPPKPKSLRNQKKLSLNLSAHSNASSTSLNIPDSPVAAAPPIPQQPSNAAAARRRPSIVSLPNASVFAHRRDEEASPSAPYIDGPIQILPGIWIGSEDNVRDWKSLVERGIRSILNVAKEVACPFAPVAEVPLRSTVSTPNLAMKFSDSERDSTYVPPHGPSGRPAMHYLRLPWSHGQTDLVGIGFVEGMTFVDQALARGDGVLVHCQCGVSRSATMVIALVMRAAHSNSPSTPPEVLALKNGGMHASYAFVKEKSKWVGPNMSLMYQLLEYERTLNSGNNSPTLSDHSSQIASEEAEWGRRRQEMEAAPSAVEEDVENLAFMQEARALDLEMEHRIVARKGSQQSNFSSNTGSSGSGMGMGTAWKSRFGYGRSRAGSVASNFTNRSVLSEDLLEEDEENMESMLDIPPDSSSGTPSTELTEEESRLSSLRTRRSRNGLARMALPPPTAPAFKQSFGLLPPPSASHTKTSFGALPPPSAPASRQTFSLQAPPKKFQKRRPPPVLLPPVPPSPVGVIAQEQENQPISSTPKKWLRQAPAPLRIPSTPTSRRSSRSSATSSLSLAPTPSQTLFVFPPEESVSTPSTLTLTSNLTGGLGGLFPSLSTPRVSTFRKEGRRRSLILATPPTPTIACSRVDVLGVVAKGP
ncbi:hypothetical protein M422DRAFT_167414 [Sphaerobolus stellatus SS14]|uniref:protein-tyrosine-phosphatase n=1 Tax=Sphaerobolus stellatus (strain SS14) TaxID=990650 RepID=A0A0C9VDL7_SPHS4|nr:hypothetical protein M422DRAFT_167414 [Sphaerobolus stellatus SS14]